LPSPIPAKLLFLTAGSGITPVMAMLRSFESPRGGPRCAPHPFRPNIG
jgi:ferredoxin-NADP reductase